MSEIWTPKTNYVNFHSHSSYSLLDCLIRVEDLVDHCVKLGTNAVAISDHGNMGSLYELYSATKKWHAKGVPIKPIYGIEFYFVDDIADRDKGTGYNHLTCFAMNETGLKNLMFLTSASYIYGLYGKPRIDWELLRTHGDGIVGLSGCVIGRVPDLLLRGEELKAYEALNRFKSVFNGNFFLELQPTSLDFQIDLNDKLVKFGEKTNTPVVMTTDSHYLEKQDFDIHETMLCIQTQTVMSNPKRFSFDCPEFYYADEQDILERIDEGHQDSVKELARASLDNSQLIVDLCNVELSFDEIYFPQFPVPEKEETFLKYWNSAKKSSLI